MSKLSKNDPTLGIRYIIKTLKKLRVAYIILTLFVLLDSINMVINNPVWYVTLWAIVVTTGWAWITYDTHKDIVQWEAILAAEEVKEEEEENESDQNAA